MVAKKGAPQKPVKRRKDGTAVIAAGGGKLVRTQSKAVLNALDDPKDVQDWDDDELKRGYRKDKNGRFNGRPPRVVPRICHDEWVRRQIQRAQDGLYDDIVPMVNALVEIGLNTKEDARARVAAIKVYMERVMGKVPDKIDVSVKTLSFVKVLEAGIVPGDEADEDDSNDVLDVVEATSKEVA